MENGKVILKGEGLCKVFPGVKALDNVDFELRAGEVHVLLGENGAGKSTLIKIFSGVHAKDGGKLYIDGKEENYSNAIAALKLGISTIYQEFNLVPHLSIAENIFLGQEHMKGGFVDWKKQYEEAAKWLKAINMDIDPRKKVKDLGVAEKQMVEIAKSLKNNAKIIIFDEPSAVLTDKELVKLFQIINDLKKQGVGIIYISHRLEEICDIGDRITVLRDGTYVDTIPVKEGEIDKWVALMVGRDITDKFPPREKHIGEELLRVEGLTKKGLLDNVSFTLRRGEVLGISGLVGAGRTELAKTIFGAIQKDSGKVFLNGKEIHIKRPLDAIRNKICYLPEERKTEGLILKLTVRENTTISSLDLNCCNHGILNLKKERMVAKDYIDKLKIKTPSQNQKVVNLSGGNQQKVVIAKWLAAQSDVFMFDEPTRGIDVGAKVEVYKLMNELLERGAGVIMISSELPEILGMSDRVIVMRHGRITGEFDIAEATQEKLLAKAWGQ